MNKDELIKLLNEQIPTSKFMNVSIKKIDEHTISLSCPLSPNHNHLGTAFGGSLSTMLILAAYCQTYELIGGRGHVLIKASETKFLRPVAEEILSLSYAPEKKNREAFLETFKRKGKAGIEVEAVIKLASGEVACTMKAQMVALTKGYT